MSGPLSGRQPGAVRSALTILGAVARARPGVTAKEIAAQVGIPAATAYRMLNLLVGEEYLVRTPDLRGFALGARFAELVGHADRRVENLVQDVRRRTGSAITLARYEDGQISIAIPDPERPPRVDQLATAHPHASAMGRLLLAELGSWRAVLPEPMLVALTPRTVTEPDLLDATLARVRQDQLAVQADEIREGSACIAVPIRNHRLIGGLVLSDDAPTVMRRMDALVPILQESAAGLALLLPA